MDFYPGSGRGFNECFEASGKKGFYFINIHHGLPPPDRIPSAHPDVSFQIHPESQNHINNQRRTQSQKRNVNKPEPDFAGCNTDFLTDGRTDAEGFPFYKVLKCR